MKEEGYYSPDVPPVYEVRLTAFGRSLRNGCLAIVIASASGVAAGAGTVKVLDAAGVHVEPGFAPLSLTVKVTTPCTASLNGIPTVEQWKTVLFDKTFGVNAQSLDVWITNDDAIGHTICDDP